MRGSVGSLDWLGVAGLPSIALDDVVAVASLQRRFDHKYVVEVARLPELIAALGTHLHVLEVDGVRVSGFSSAYFDTPDLRTYRDHLQRRRRRFKIRTRHYGDPATTMLELKCKGRRKQTVKHRWPHPGKNPTSLGSQAEALLEQALDDEYGFVLPAPLAPVATTSFQRITLVDVAAMERVTIDLDLTIEANDRSLTLGANHAVMETKSAQRVGAATRTLYGLGVRPERVSKYCVGIAASHDTVRGNPWLPVLRRVAPASGSAKPE